MSKEDRPESLADQAAAWIPPWQRPAPPAEADDVHPGAKVPVQGRAETDISDAAGPQAAEADAEPVEPVPGQAAEPVEAAPAQAAEVVEVVPVEPVPGQAAELVEAAPAQDVEPIAAVRAGAADGPARKSRAGRPRPVPEPTPVLDDAELRGALEAILLVVDEPVSELTLAQVLDQPAERVGPMLDEIAAGYVAAGHGFELRRAAGGWRLYTRPEYASYVERFVLDGQSVRLTQAALETLAVVAYKQPVTRSRISAIRGVNCDGVIRTLVSRGLIEECGTETDSGAYLYRTSIMFLEKLGLNSLDDLPPLAPFLPDDVEELADATR
ncbi:SMC-Scp complex subunit ScpB [Micromonospora sp. FIMYZ51]|uniref:SMC-Scp complex subunit ScpB n=1 Tax=Micromonospora sp. FIMYZ51 TaxID=3051832 RepID=UPI00311DACF6